MKKMLLFLLVAVCLGGCDNKPYTQPETRVETISDKTMSAEDYISVIEGFTCEKAAYINGSLYIAIDAVSDDNYDALAQQFLDEATGEGVDAKGVFIVDSKSSQFAPTEVKGKRIGRAFK